MKRLVTRGSLIVAAFALAGGGLAVSPAGAAAPVTKCATLKGSVTISPGIALTPHAQTATAKANLTKCTPTKATGGSGVFNGKLALPKSSSCGSLAKGNQALKLNVTTKWKNGKTSTYALVAKTGSGKTALVATITGKVSKGLFANKKVASQIKIAPKKGQDCSPGHPIKNLTFTNTKPWTIG